MVQKSKHNPKKPREGLSKQTLIFYSPNTLRLFFNFFVLLFKTVFVTYVMSFANLESKPG